MTQDEAYSVIEKHYRTNYDMLVKRFTKYYGDRSRAEDVISETFIRALTYWKNLPSDPTHLTAYFNTIANNAGKNNAKEERMHGAVDKPEDMPEEAAPEVIIPSVIYKQVMEKVEGQKEPVRSVLLYFFVDNLKLKDIVKLTNIPVGTLGHMIYKFRESIRKEYKWSI